MNTNKLNLNIALIRIYLIIMIFEGAIRYVLNIFDAAFLIYIKDAIIILLFILSIRKIELNKKSITMFIIFSISLVTGIIYVGNIKQIAFFILKVLMIFIVGMMQYKNIIEDFKRNTKFYKICYIVTITGVILNMFCTFPWEGLEYELSDDLIINASRAWSTGGVKRIAGFSRASYSVASQVVIFSLLIMSNIKRTYKRIIIYIITSYIIWITTTKGILIAYIIVAFTDLNFIKNRKNICKLIATAGIILMVGLPLFSTVCDPVFNFLKNNVEKTTYWRYISSFEARVKGTWPDSFEKVITEGNFILGKGFGGIGAAEQLFGVNTTTPGDNMFVYMYATIGITALIVIIWILLRLYKLKISEKEEKNIYNILLIIIFYGIISNIVEEPILCLCLGICVGYIMNYNTKRIGAKNENINS